jgi:hypothetical protein
LPAAQPVNHDLFSLPRSNRFARSNESKVLCRKKWYRSRDQIEFHANKLLFLISSGRGKKVEKELKEIFANITTNNNADVEGPGGKSSANAGDDEEGDAYATQMNEFF